MKSWLPQINIKGKKTLKLRCRCCHCVNLKIDSLENEAKKEERLAKYSLDNKNEES